LLSTTVRFIIKVDLWVLDVAVGILPRESFRTWFRIASTQYSSIRIPDCTSEYLAFCRFLRLIEHAQAISVQKLNADRHDTILRIDPEECAKPAKCAK